MSLVFMVFPPVALKYFFRGKFHFILKDWRNIFLIFAFLMPLFWPFLPEEILHFRNVNFLQHMIGGGVAVGFMGIYFIQNLKSFFSYRNLILEIIFIFALVSVFGVVNEILEFYLDLLGVGIFSADRYDTWFDLVANSTGALSIFFVYKFFILQKKLFRS